MKHTLACALIACFSAIAVAEELTAAQIIDKNVEARGGLEAWRKVQSVVWAGHIESARAPAAKMPFILEQKRPNKTRFEMKAQNQMSLRTYDGANGWKVRPSSSGKPELQPYNSEELVFAHDGPGLDGPLMDYTAKGITVLLGGVDEIEGHKAYRLDLRLPSGVSQQVWIDAQTFLDIKYVRLSRNASGQIGMTSVFYRNYRTLEGLQIPQTIETGADASQTPDRMVIDKIAFNPPLEDQRFEKPRMPGQHRGVTVDTRAQEPQVPPNFPGAPTRPPPLAQSGVRVAQ